MILLAQTRQADRDKAHADADAQHREALSLASLAGLRGATVRGKFPSRFLLSWSRA